MRERINRTIAVIVAICLSFGQIGCISKTALTTTEVEELSDQGVEGNFPPFEAIKKLSDQDILSNLATEDKRWFVRREAVEKLTDQTLLAKIAVRDEDRSVRRSAVVKLTDQVSLAKIAVEEKDRDVRYAAVKKLTDQVILAKIAVEEKDRDIRHTAVVKLTDQVSLAKIAVEEKDRDVRYAAVKKLTDQVILAKIAVEEKDRDIRHTAVKKLTDQTLLAKISVEDWERDIRREAVEKLTDQTLLAKIAVEDWERDVRHAAVEKLTDKALLAKIAVEEKDKDVRLSAVLKLADKASLAKIPFEEKDKDARRAVIRNLNFKLNISPESFLQHVSQTEFEDILHEYLEHSKLISVNPEGPLLTVDLHFARTGWWTASTPSSVPHAGAIIGKHAHGKAKVNYNEQEYQVSGFSGSYKLLASNERESILQATHLYFGNLLIDLAGYGIGTWDIIDFFLTTKRRRIERVVVPEPSEFAKQKGLSWDDIPGTYLNKTDLPVPDYLTLFANNYIAQNLLRIGPPILARAKGLLFHKHWWIRNYCLQVLREANDPSTTDLIINLLHKEVNVTFKTKEEAGLYLELKNTAIGTLYETKSSRARLAIEKYLGMERDESVKNFLESQSYQWKRKKRK